MILLGYFLVWLPQPVTGLSFIGLEMGEWSKFIPQVNSGEFEVSRNLFYLPPICLSLMLLVWTFAWPEGRWQTWAMRLIAISISLLALPAIESLLDEPADQWLFRLLLVGIVTLVFIISPFAKKISAGSTGHLSWLMISAMGIVCLILPIWSYLVIRPVVSELFRMPVAIGPGLWLNIVGSILVAGVSLFYFAKGNKIKPLK